MHKDIYSLYPIEDYHIHICRPSHRRLIYPYLSSLSQKIDIPISVVPLTEDWHTHICRPSHRRLIYPYLSSLTEDWHTHICHTSQKIDIPISVVPHRRLTYPYLSSPTEDWHTHICRPSHRRLTYTYLLSLTQDWHTHICHPPQKIDIPIVVNMCLPCRCISTSLFQRDQSQALMHCSPVQVKFGHQA